MHNFYSDSGAAPVAAHRLPDGRPQPSLESCHAPVLASNRDCPPPATANNIQPDKQAWTFSTQPTNRQKAQLIASILFIEFSIFGAPGPSAAPTNGGGLLTLSAHFDSCPQRCCLGFLREFCVRANCPDRHLAARVRSLPTGPNTWSCHDLRGCLPC